MKQLTKRQHGLLAFGILMLLIALVSNAAIKPAVAHYREQSARLETLEDQLQRFLSVAAQKEAATEEYKLVTERNRNLNSFLPKTAPSLAAARLQQQVQTLVEGNGGQLMSTQPIKADAADAGYMPITIRVHLRGDINSLTKILHALESNRPLVFVDNLSIRIARGGLGRGSPDRQDVVLLSARFEITGYMPNEQT